MQYVETKRINFFTSPAGAVAKYCDEYVCLWVCLSVCPRGYLRNHTRDLYYFLRMLPMSVARLSSGMLTIGRIAYQREGDDGSAQRGRSVIYDCLVIFCVMVPCGRRSWLPVSLFCARLMYHTVSHDKYSSTVSRIFTSPPGWVRSIATSSVSPYVCLSARIPQS